MRLPGTMPLRYSARALQRASLDTAGVIDTRTSFALSNAADPDAQADALGTLLGMLYPHVLCARDSAIPAAVPTLIPID